MAHSVPRPGPLATLCVGATLISLAPILVKALSREIGPTSIGMWRCALGALILFSFAAASRRGFGVRRQVMGLLVLAGLAFAADLFVWHRAIVLAGAGMATILANTQVFGTAILSALFLGERLTLRFIVAATSAMAGVVLLVGVGSEVAFTTDYVRGVVYGLATGIAYAAFLVLLRAAGRGRDGASGLRRLAWLSLYATIFLTAPALAESEPVMPVGWQAWLLLALLGLIAQSLAWWMIAESLVRVKGAVGGLVLLLQPVLATVWGVLFLRESLQPLQVVGAGVTLAAIYAGSARSGK